MIREAGERVGALADAQVQIIEQTTDSELASWGVTREEAKNELRYDELERLGRIYKSAIVKRQNNNITTEKYWGPSWIKNFGEVYPPWPSVEFTRMCARVSAVLSFDKGLDLLTDILPHLRAEIQAHIDTPRTNKERWVIVENLKWVLEQDDLPPNLPLDERKYHPEYNALIVSVGQRIGGENIVSILANAEDDEVAAGGTSMGNPLHSSPSPPPPRRSARVARAKAKATGPAKRQRIRSPSPDLNILAYRRYRIEHTNDTQCDGKILDLLDNPTPEKYAKLEPEVVEDLMVADKIRDILYEWEGIDEDSYKILPDARIIHRLNMVLNGERLMVRPVPRNTTPPPALTKLHTISTKEYEEEEDDDDDEEEDDEEEEEEED
ncbi:hypothetical protein EV426DRAFT_709377 [Tirmania nivea]|nr:hypothetical protein EV426DRAFT_709377 [Tirmania nivea]